MPIAEEKAIRVSNTAGSVSSVPITSAVLNFQMLLAKCSARKRSGRPVKALRSLGSKVELLVAKIVLSGASPASFS